MPNLDLLDVYLSSDEEHPKSLGLSDLDGFLTGIICCPETIPPKEWLDFALGDADETPGAVVGEVRKLFEKTKSRLEAGQPVEPVFWRMQDGSLIAMDWCEGFIISLNLHKDSWDPLLRMERTHC